jgi:hypothetical protein
VLGKKSLQYLQFKEDPAEEQDSPGKKKKKDHKISKRR